MFLFKNLILGDNLNNNLVGNNTPQFKYEDGKLVLSPADDAIFGYGGDDTLRGRGGDDDLFGGFGDDILHGGVGNDRLFGGPGNDTLYGGIGNDHLNGGFGDDTLVGGQRGDHVEIDHLTGGWGSDRFLLGDFHGNAYSEHGDDDYAVITDFTKGQDIVQLDQAMYTLGNSPIQDISGTAIYHGSELIGILEGVDQSNLVFENVSFVTTLS